MFLFHSLQTCYSVCEKGTLCTNNVSFLWYDLSYNLKKHELDMTSHLGQVIENFEKLMPVLVLFFLDYQVILIQHVTKLWLVLLFLYWMTYSLNHFASLYHPITQYFSHHQSSNHTIVFSSPIIDSSILTYQTTENRTSQIKENKIGHLEILMEV